MQWRKDFTKLGENDTVLPLCRFVYALPSVPGDARTQACSTFIPRGDGVLGVVPALLFTFVYCAFSHEHAVLLEAVCACATEQASSLQTQPSFGLLLFIYRSALDCTPAEEESVR